MCCVLVLLAFFTPRIVLFLLWLFSNSYLSSAFETALWPILGFFFAPWTALTWVLCAPGGITGFDVVLVVLAVIVDVSTLGGGAFSRRRNSTTAPA